MTITAVDGPEVVIITDLLVVTTTIAGTTTDPAGISTGITIAAMTTMVAVAS
jgi:hypothetical protein